MFKDFLNLKQETKRTKCRTFHLSLYSKKELQNVSNVMLYKTQQET